MIHQEVMVVAQGQDGTVDPKHDAKVLGVSEDPPGRPFTGQLINYKHKNGVSIHAQNTRLFRSRYVNRRSGAGVR